MLLKVMSTIALSRDGMSETKIRQMNGVPYHLWSNLYYAIEPHLVTKKDKIE